MKYKLLLFTALILGATISNNAQAECPFGVCKLKKIVAHRLINPTDRIVTGYKVSSSRVSLMIHLPSSSPNLWSNPIVSKNFYRNGFDVEIRYGGDLVKIWLRGGKKLEIENSDYTGIKHQLFTVMPHSVNNLKGRSAIKISGNTIEISMPRY